LHKNKIPITIVDLVLYTYNLVTSFETFQCRTYILDVISEQTYASISGEM